MTPKEMAIILDIESGLPNKKDNDAKNTPTTFKMILYKYKKLTLKDFESLQGQALYNSRSSRGALIFLRALKNN